MYNLANDYRILRYNASLNSEEKVQVGKWL